MKEKTFVTLSREVLKGIDQIAGSKHSRSSIIEGVLRRYLRERKLAMHAEDLQLINAAATELNAEAADVLGYQAID
jgi:metal-responsive CopG/Arc/MetJ family transcriptional regulator